MGRSEHLKEKLQKAVRSRKVFSLKPEEIWILTI